MNYTPKPKDYQADFNKEDGNYTHICAECNMHFIGHKHRIVCKECNNKVGAL